MYANGMKKIKINFLTRHLQENLYYKPNKIKYILGDIVFELTNNKQ